MRMEASWTLHTHGSGAVQKVSRGRSRGNSNVNWTQMVQTQISILTNRKLVF